MAATAAQITRDIRCLLEDARLDYIQPFKVTTKVKGDHYETTIVDCNPDAAEKVLSERARTIPGITFDRRVYDGALVVRQPV